MSFEIWDLAKAEYPYEEDRSQTKGRPVIIIDDLGDQFTLCPLTKQLRQGSRYKYTITIEKDSIEGIAMGLTYSSLIILDKLGDFRKILLFGKPTRCPDLIIEKIEELLEEMKRNGDY